MTHPDPSSVSSTRHSTTSLDYHILNTPGLALNPAAASAAKPQNLVGLLLGQKLHFQELSTEVIRQLLRERQMLRDRNHTRIMSEITDVSGDISCCDNQPYSPEARERKPGLAKMKADLERQLREENVALWQDTEELRQALIEADRHSESGKLRAELLGSVTHDENKGTNDATNSG